ncbi:MAG: deoxyuridine 5'-triphosphate nucleotidohydrolase [Candidatus Heimdallarchaeota archaeon]|nr:MAG: deoxyuridine 5'-triphosphate nucleotidohydrolase [Candidatus Gerdarchaeota archaeon]
MSEEKKPSSDFSAVWMDDFKTIIRDAVDFDKQVQVNGFDLTVKEVFLLKGEGVIDFDNSKRILPEYEPVPLIDNDYWSLPAGSYVIRYNEIVSVPLDALGIIQPRSTLLRMGGTIVGAWWDAGYSGRGQGLMILTRPVKIYKNARVAQIVFLRTKKVTKGYQGTYQNEAK